MPSNLPGLLTSRTFEIKSSDKSFHVHSKILASHSEPFRSTITGTWKETTERRIDLFDWDSGTVGRFVEFLYTENYHASVSEEEDKMEEWDAMNKPDIVESVPDWERVEARDMNLLRVHAKVYALAQYKDIEALQKMALEKLKKELGCIRDGISNSRTAVGVIELLDYVYGHTASLSSSIEPMRDVVSSFAAVNIDGLMGQSEMESLLDKGGDFVVDLMGKVTGEFSNTKDQTVRLQESIRKLESTHENDVQALMLIKALKTSELEASASRRRLLRDHRVAAPGSQSLWGILFQFPAKVWTCYRAVGRLDFDGAIEKLEVQMDEWMLNRWVLSLCVVAVFRAILVAAVVAGVITTRVTRRVRRVLAQLVK